MVHKRPVMLKVINAFIVLIVDLLALQRLLISWSVEAQSKVTFVTCQQKIPSKVFFFVWRGKPMALIAGCGGIKPASSIVFQNRLTSHPQGARCMGYVKITWSAV